MDMTVDQSFQRPKNTQNNTHHSKRAVDMLLECIIIRHIFSCII